MRTKLSSLQLGGKKFPPSASLTVEHAESKEEQSTQCLRRFQQKSTKIQLTPALRSANHHIFEHMTRTIECTKCTAIITQINSISLSMDKILLKGNNNNLNNWNPNYKKDSVYQLQTDLSASLSSRQTKVKNT